MKITPQMVMKVIRRTCPLTEEQMIPERKLLMAAIGQHVNDLFGASPRTAASFFFSARFEEYCDLLELNHIAVREILERGKLINQP